MKMSKKRKLKDTDIERGEMPNHKRLRRNNVVEEEKKEINFCDSFEMKMSLKDKETME
jgi:hypothetical protein